jgi:hypothetical protein
MLETRGQSAAPHLAGLCIDVGIFRHRRFDARKLSFLLVVSDGGAPHAPGFTPLTHSGVVDIAAEHQRTT